MRSVAARTSAIDALVRSGETKPLLASNWPAAVSSGSTQGVATSFMAVPPLRQIDLARSSRRCKMIASCNHRQLGGLMGQVVIRNIDDRVIETLKARAATQQKSLEQSLREILAAAAAPSRAELLAEVKRIRAKT